MVYLNGINAIKYGEEYILMDRNITRPIFVSNRVYDIVTRLKQGENINILEEQYGKDTLDNILNHIQCLITENVLRPSGGNFYEEGIREVRKYAKSPISILEGMFMVSQDCNMACRYCYGGKSGTFNNKGLMEIETAEKYFRYLLLAGNNRDFQKVVFIGGEPLLNMRVIKHIVLLWEKIKDNYNDRRVFFTLTTNGMLLTSENVEFFKKYNVGVAISLDGPKSIHDHNRMFIDGSPTFDKVMQGIELLKKNRMPISIRTTVTRNVDLLELHAFFEEHGFDIHTISLVDYPMIKPEKSYQFGIEDYKKFILQEKELMRKGYKDIISDNKDSFAAKQLSVSYHKSQRENSFFLCGAGNWIVSFGIDGYIYPCNRLVGHEKFRIGDVNNGIDKEKVKKLFTSFLEVSQNCNRCWASAKCKGRCFYERSNEQDEMEEISDELCEVYRDSLAESLSFSHMVQVDMCDKNKNIWDAISRYDPNKMMEEYLG